MKAVLPHSTAFFPLTARLPVVQKILSTIPSLSSPDHFQIMRVAAVIVDTNIRELFIHNGMFSTMVMSEILNKLTIRHTVRTEPVAVPDMFPGRVFGHSFIEIDGMHIDLASQIAPYCALANYHGIDAYVTDREKMAALFKTHNIDPQELCYFDDKAEVPIEILGRHFASSALPPAKRFLVPEGDAAKVTDGFPLEFFRKAAESPKYYIDGMPPAQKKMWDSVVARGLRTDFFDF